MLHVAQRCFCCPLWYTEPFVCSVVCSVYGVMWCSVIGLYEGYKRLKDGKSKIITFTQKDVLKIAHTGGSIIRTSKMHPTTAQEVDNVLRVLEHLRVRYLVTIGGTITAQSSTRVAAAAKASKLKLSIVHVPKTIFNGKSRFIHRRPTVIHRPTGDPIRSDPLTPSVSYLHCALCIVHCV